MCSEVEQKTLKGSWKEIKGGNLVNFDKASEFIEGKLVDVRTGQGKFESIVYDIEKNNGELVSVFGSTVLDGRMKRVSIGQFVKIQFNGVVESRDGRKYNDFSVFVKEQGNSSAKEQEKESGKGDVKAKEEPLAQ